MRTSVLLHFPVTTRGTISCYTFDIMHARCQLLSGRLPSNSLAIRSAQSTQRTYATSTPAPPVKNPLQRRRGGDLGSHLPKNVIPKDAYIPAYPYGPYQLFKQANKGLYGEQMIQYGNNVSERTETKTRRKWKPNVLSKSLYSVALKKRIKLRITAKVLKTMDREGGLDEYLLKDNEHRIKELGPMGWALRWTLMQRPEVIQRVRADAAALGIDQAAIDKQWPTTEMVAAQRAAQGELSSQAQAFDFSSAEFEETPEQEMWDPEDADMEPSDAGLLSKAEEKFAHATAGEYTRAVKAAQRYSHRGLVDSEEQGLKLAFVREKERIEAAARIHKDFKEKLNQFSAEDLQAIRSRFNLPNISDLRAKTVAYNQQKRQQIEAAGGLEAWKAAKAAEFKAQPEPKDVDLSQMQKKAEYARLIAEAETAATNASLDKARRNFLQSAMTKANRAIRARAEGGQEAYVNAALDDLRLSKASTDLSSLKQVAQQAKSSGGDAWAALVKPGARQSDVQPRA